MKLFLMAPLIFISALSHGAAQYSSKELMTSLLEGNQRFVEGDLGGGERDFLRRTTHANSNPHLSLEKSPNVGACNVIIQTLSVPNIPMANGKSAGDWVIKSKVAICPDGKFPIGLKPSEVLSCKIGSVDCTKFGVPN